MRNFYPTNTRLEKLRIKSDNNLEIFERRLEDMINLRDLRLQGVKLYDDRILIRICMNNKYTLTVLKLDVWKLPIDGKNWIFIFIFVITSPLMTPTPYMRSSIVYLHYNY